MNGRIDMATTIAAGTAGGAPRLAGASERPR
jgi:hypothetical protein